MLWWPSVRSLQRQRDEPPYQLRRTIWLSQPAGNERENHKRATIGAGAMMRARPEPPRSTKASPGIAPKWMVTATVSPASLIEVEEIPRKQPIQLRASYGSRYTY